MRLTLVIGVLVHFLGGEVLAQSSLADYRQQPFTLSGDVRQLLVVDGDGNGLQDLLVVHEDRVELIFQQPSGFAFDDSKAVVELDGQAVGWDISFGYGSADTLSLIALLDGSRVQAWHIRDGRFSAPELLQSGLSGFITKGVNRLRFSRDINGDGLDDLVIPGAGVLALYIRNADGSYQAPLTVQSQADIRTRLEAGGLQGDIGQAVVIPLMQLQELNGDGHADLVSRTEAALEVFLADPVGPAYFNPTPSYALDLLAIEAGLGEFDIDRLDFSNLTGVLSLTHQELLEDVTGDGIADLVLREGGKVSLFTGNAAGMNLERPTQVLLSSGNVLSTFLYDENEDGRQDLWLWRVEPISVGDLFLWLAISGNIAVEAFVYPNEGSSFARRPSRKLTVTLRFPSALRMASSVLDIARQARESADTPLAPSQAAQLDDNLQSRDLLVMAGDAIDVFLNTLEPETPVTDQFLSGMNYSRSRDDYVIDVGEIINNVSVGGSRELAIAGSREPDFRIGLSRGIGAGDFVPLMLDADGRDDILVFFSRSGSQLEGLLLLSSAP
ncbi:MAG: hypothetical protein RLZZ385_2401 [Pseudomonadota bacterium]